MRKNTKGESEESNKTMKEYEHNTKNQKKSKIERLKSKKVFPSDEEKHEVNIFSIKISPDFSLFKKIIEATGDDMDLFKSLNSDEDSVTSLKDFNTIVGNYLKIIFLGH